MTQPQFFPSTNRAGTTLAVRANSKYGPTRSSRARIYARLIGSAASLSAADIAADLACCRTRVAAQLKHMTDNKRVFRIRENRCYVYRASSPT
jgi:DNA-binding transcriptional regulator GbsR (MarR family)